MKDFLRYILQNLVDKSDQVQVREVPASRSILLEITLAQEDIGKIVGRKGQMITALRTILHAIGSKEGTKINIEIIEGQNPYHKPSHEPLCGTSPDSTRKPRHEPAIKPEGHRQ